MRHILRLLLTLVIATSFASAAEPPIDFDRARDIMDRARRGERVSAEERAYVERAKEARKAGNQSDKADAPPPWTEHLAPLTELGKQSYKGELGGLYGSGENAPPPEHAAAAARAAEAIVPRSPDGRPAADGKIGLVAIGMSNTTQEFSRFIAEAARDAAKSKRVVLIDGAQGGQTGERWANPAAPLWSVLDERVRAAGVTPAQVQVAWMKQAEAGPARLGEFPAHALVLERNITATLALLKQRFPNLRIVYLSSRIYGGYAKSNLNPEPYAYESAFAVRRVITAQIAGKSELNFDAARGPVRAPLVLWGPYLWADGATPRGDGLSYSPEDFGPDGTHPSDRGRAKVAAQLLAFLKTDATSKPWFVETAEPSVQSTTRR